MIAIVDACSGNLRSVERALAHVGGDVCVTRDPDVVRRADKIVVPGQGAFAMFMRGLVERDLGEALREAIASGRPYLGICLGLQILFDTSDEYGTHAGLGVLGGSVVRFAGEQFAAGSSAGAAAGSSLKVPHMGWNRVRAPAEARPDPLFAGIAKDPYVYFVHSYHAVPLDPAIVALETTHGDRFCAAIRKDNLFACQFHPEKSQAVGLAILENFVTA